MVLGDGSVEHAPAKINLALHVRSRRADGYHIIETLFAFAAHGDVLRYSPADDLSLRMDGPFAPGLAADADNLVLRAAHVLAQHSGVDPRGALTLTKNLPVAAGIGGGSADAAAALRLLARMWDVRPDMADLGRIAATLGADVPSCLHSVVQMGSGLGDVVADVHLHGLANAPLLLVNPRVACPTGPVFAEWDGVDRGPLNAAEWKSARNDLAVPARALVPVIGDVLDLLARQRGTTLVRMSGSGATCFALFDTMGARDAAAAAVAVAMPSAWIMASHVR